jgi:TPR repeat protein
MSSPKTQRSRYESAAGADARGQARAGEALRTGNGVASNLPRAVALLKPAADRQDPDAMVSLGFIHATAKGELAQRDEGLRLLRAAAAAHVPEAEIRLGELLAFGTDGIEPEPEGRKWLMVAASRKDTRGALGLARIYRDGLGVKADWTEAAKWAHNPTGNWSGAVFIGRLLQKGGPNWTRTSTRLSSSSSEPMEKATRQPWRPFANCCPTRRPLS